MDFEIGGHPQTLGRDKSLHPPETGAIPPQRIELSPALGCAEGQGRLGGSLRVSLRYSLLVIPQDWGIKGVDDASLGNDR